MSNKPEVEIRQTFSLENATIDGKTSPNRQSYSQLAVLPISNIYRTKLTANIIVKT